MNLLTQHIVWKFKSIIPYGSMLLAATALVHGWAGDALSPSMEKVGSKAPTETVLGQFVLQGDYQEAWGFLPSFGKHF